MGYHEQESSDEAAVRRRMERCLELTGMFKEVGKGSMNKAKQIIAKFSLQEGVSQVKAKGYFNLLKESGLIIVTKGEKLWVYHSEAEWELFRVNI